jgi:1,5-anhydro-D-fructose reductase (1,5-anhydro-D-mannitol-forming)
MDMAKFRVGIVGLDHWYAGLGAIRELKDHPRAELVTVAHWDLDHARETIEQAGAVATDDYAAVAARDDLDIIITACPTADNAAHVCTAARAGKHVLSVKPHALNLEQANAISSATKAGKVFFMSFESLYRVTGATQLYKQWLDSGRLGAPISVFAMMRSSLPDQVWPNVRGRTWWLDPNKMFGGGWVDHAIYQIDHLRYLFGSEVVRVSGEVANLKHKGEPLEDFGVANVVFGNGAVATIEVTWTIESTGFMQAFHLVGAKAQLVSEPTFMPDQLKAVDFTAGDGWQTLSVPGRSEGQSLFDHLLDCIEGQAEPVAGPYDSFKNLQACLAFDQAAKTHQVVHL